MNTPRATRSRGFVTVLVVVYGIFALSATARSLVQILRDFSAAPVAYLLSLVAALTYIAAAVLLARRGGEDSPAALVLCSVELAGVVGVGLLTVLDPALFPDDTVWSRFGSGYGYVPLVLPMVAIAYLLHRRRRRTQGSRPEVDRATAPHDVA
ncbi:hypothetical protein JSY14_01235 [Brachybacterium sp. EF45031]|uniref:hypothetical protein n=1 Tax=Brachybacterium sillae TaxID=2810536 RepID=UPI00217E5990|nr:hypothetical protein [Brachybacterium sillae]MCS6710709.1 hypothetical protein [Brachybacterium sillae]